jgi:acetylornithine aminotransferase
LIFDEVQCGTGRTGEFTAGQLFGVTPDIITLAKGIGSGFPMAVLLVNERGLAATKPGSLGSTFGGGPLACAAGLATLEAISDEEMIGNAARVGAYLKENLQRIDGVSKVQGAGLLLGIEVEEKAAEIRDRLLSEHRVVAGTSVPAHVLRIMPPLSITRDLADRFLEALACVLSKGKE